jgi:hypothetical protein
MFGFVAKPKNRNSPFPRGRKGGRLAGCPGLVFVTLTIEVWVPRSLQLKLRAVVARKLLLSRKGRDSDALSLAQANGERTALEARGQT